MTIFVANKAGGIASAWQVRLLSNGFHFREGLPDVVKSRLRDKGAAHIQRD